MLTEAQRRAREGRLTASRVACLMEGDADKIHRLWLEMTGHPDHVPEDLSLVWPVRLGETTEALNLVWYSIKTGRRVTRIGEMAVSRLADWAAATLDGWDDELGCPIECKHVGGFEPREKVIARYLPQTTWQMLCTNARQVMLSIIEGAREPVIEIVDFDADYANELWRRAEAFMQCVRDLTPPAALAPVAAPVKAEKVYDMTGNNAWAAHAGTWRETREAAKAFDGAAKEIKALVAADAARAHGHGIAVTRSKAGSLTIREA